MTIEEAVSYYGSAYALAKQLKITSQNIYYWKKKGNLVPEKYQHRLERLTQGQLKAVVQIVDKDRRHNPPMIACPHCNQPIDLDEKHARLYKKDFKQRGIDHGD